MTAQLAIEALVPFKRFGQAKERLAGLLSPTQREDLARLLLHEALGALVAAPSVRRVWLISADAEARGLARRLGAVALDEPSNVRGLNPALEAARRRILVAPDPPHALLVLHADIAGLNPADIEAFLAEPGAGPLLRLCPARDGGSNAMLLFPPDAVPFRYGPDSAALHRAEAAARGIASEVHVAGNLQDDLDTPQDVLRLLSQGRNDAASNLLRSFGIAARLKARH